MVAPIAVQVIATNESAANTVAVAFKKEKDDRSSVALNLAAPARSSL